MTNGKLFSQVELAHIFGVRTATIREWEAAGCPVERKAEKAGQASLYRAADVIAWDRERAVKAATGDMAAADMNELRRRKLTADTNLAEIALAEKSGDVASLTVLRSELGHMLSGLRARLVAIPAIVAPALALATTTAERQRIVEAAIFEALDELSGHPHRFLGPRAGK